MAKNKSILFVYPTLRVGGAERMLQRLVNGLSETWECSVAYLDQGKDQSVVDFLPAVKLIRLPVKRTRYAHYWVLNLVRRLQPDIVFSSWSRTNLLLLSIRAFLPKKTAIVIREPNLPSFILPKLKWQFFYEFLYKYLYRKAEVIICQSQLMEAELENFYQVPSKCLIVLHNILPIEEILSKTDEPITEFDLQPMDVLSCGRLVPQKGFDILLDSFFDVKKQYPAARLILLGEELGVQNQRKILEEKVCSLGLQNSVLMPGHIINPYKFMSKTALYVSSSRWEGLPNTVLEAMACGATIVATDCPGATAEIIKSGENGWLVPTENADALTEAICKVLSGEWRLCPDQVREHAKTFDISQSLPKFDSVLSSYVCKR